MGRKKILVSLTTLSSMYKMNLDSSWESKIEEIKENHLEEISLFLTGLEKDERVKLYKALEKTPIKRIPHVHLRADMDYDELDYLVQKYHTEVFNSHSTRDWPLLHDYGKYMAKIYLENGETVPTQDELDKFAGICIDFAHWKDSQLRGDSTSCREMENIVDKYKIGCSHVSAIKSQLTLSALGEIKYDSHILEDMRELDYVEDYKKYLSGIICIELENPIGEQLKAKEYLEKIINR